MKQWISRLILTAGLSLLLLHNIVAHHHDEEDDAIEHAEHHPDDPLEHVNIDHIFYTDHSFDYKLPVVVACLSILPELGFTFFQEEKIETRAIAPTEPYPPDRTSDPNILRGPPAYC
jgi:hypothetical protein